MQTSLDGLHRFYSHLWDQTVGAESDALHVHVGLPMRFPVANKEDFRGCFLRRFVVGHYPYAVVFLDLGEIMSVSKRGKNLRGRYRV